MEKRINTLLFFFIIVVVISLSGFFNSYIKFIPDFQKFPFIIHIHFSVFSLWFLLLIVQPLLIKQKNLKLHRKLGKLSYILAPILVLTIMILAKNQIEREILEPDNHAPVTAFIALIDILSLSLYYFLAMLHSKNRRWHVAFLLAATLVILNPGLSRLLNQIQFGLGMIVAVLLPFAFSIFALIFEKIKYKQPILKSPYFLYLCIWTLTIFLFVTIPQTEFWSQFIYHMFT
jgi:heme/copper-type cytochrome/quinol oxidase subunit 4